MLGKVAMAVLAACPNQLPPFSFDLMTFTLFYLIVISCYEVFARMVSRGSRLASWLIVLLMSNVANTANTFRMTWSTQTFGPDRPWQAVEIQVESNRQIVSSIQEEYSQVTFCRQNIQLPAGVGYTGGAKQADGSQADLGTDSWDIGNNMEPLDGMDMAVHDSIWGILPDGSTYPLSVGSLALGAPGTINQSFPTNPGNPNINATLLPGWLSTLALPNKILSSNSYGLHIGSASQNIPPSLYFGGFDQSRVLGEVSTQQGSADSADSIELFDNLTISVPFKLLNLTLTAPLTTTPTAYFPCKAETQTHYQLGRAFLRAAFVGGNWNADNRSATWWLAQAPGPNLPSQVNIVVVGDEDRSISGSTADWTSTWKGSWKALASEEGTNVTATGTGNDPASTSDIDSSTSSNPPSTPGTPSPGLSTGAKAGIGIGAAAGALGVLAALLLLWWKRSRNNKSDMPDYSVQSSQQPIATTMASPGGGTSSTPNSPPQMSVVSPMTLIKPEYRNSGFKPVEIEAGDATPDTRYELH
ncbi:hypothetical protein DL98DRAFT_627196 [Cadophora sp. DSE1049]|nr:hypothetical protein DL98DRAFT_627196 [Cadophora sp. DSE1049]